MIRGMVQNPPKCQKIESLGTCLEDWLSKKEQYEELMDSQGNQCKVSDGSLMAGLYKLMPESLEETVMSKQDELNSFESLFEVLRHSLQLSHRDLSNNLQAQEGPGLDGHWSREQGQRQEHQGQVAPIRER